jgi:hypothetical protein
VSHGHTKQTEDLFILCLHALISGRSSWEGRGLGEEKFLADAAWDLALAAENKLQKEKEKGK